MRYTVCRIDPRLLRFVDVLFQSSRFLPSDDTFHEPLPIVHGTPVCQDLNRRHDFIDTDRRSCITDSPVAVQNLLLISN